MITVYTTQNCQACQLLKDYLKKNKIDYNELDAAEPNNFLVMSEATGKSSVPQVEYLGKWMVGFSKKALEQLLDDNWLDGDGTDAYQVCENCQ